MWTMRGVSASSRAKRPVRAVWTDASDPKRWGTFVEAFAGWGLKFHAEVVGGPSDPPGVGTQVALSKLGGPPMIRCRVGWWDPLRGMTVMVQSGGWLTGYHGTFTIRVSELDDQLTSLEMSMQVVFLNRLVELTSLLMPAGMLYRKRLLKVLALLSETPA